VAGAAEEVLVAKQVIVATGSNARQLPGAEFDEDLILSNDGALRIGAVPKKLGVIGSGVIGLEMGSVWRRLGAEVTILEAMPTFLARPTSVAKEAQGLHQAGPEDRAGREDRRGQDRQEGRHRRYTNAKGEAQTLEVDKLIVSIGRVPNTIGLNAEAVGLKLDERGAIVVDADCKTNLPACGRWATWCAARCWRTRPRKRAWRGRAHRRPARPRQLQHHPWVIYTSPEIAWVGKTEQQLKADGVAYKAGQFPSWPTAARARWATPPASSSSWPMPRPTRSWACTSSARWPRADLRSRGGDGVQGLGRGHRAHLPRPPVAERGDQGSRPGGGQAHAELLALRGLPRLPSARPPARPAGLFLPFEMV
jgi:pyruvate/2-oxoglutarate dehydrogenase complex dihydrolipoamide dehydrogenase (E3) component